MSVPARVLTLVVAFLAVTAGCAFLVIHYLLAVPAAENFTAGVTPDKIRGVTIDITPIGSVNVTVQYVTP